MYKKTIKYVDYNGEEREEDFYFNLTKAELAIMSASRPGGLEEHLTRIVQEKDITKIMEEFQAIIHKSYGERSPDGRRFIKSDELSTAFEQTEAYSDLVMELLSDANKAAKFIEAILPASLVEKAGKMNPSLPTTT